MRGSAASLPERNVDQAAVLRSLGDMNETEHNLHQRRER